MSRAYAEQRDFGQIPTYSDADFLTKISRAAELDKKKRSLLVADLASGPGKLSRDLQGLTPQHIFLQIEISAAQIEKARAANQDPRNRFVVADIRHMPEVPSESVNAVVARYTIKDLTLGEKFRTLREIGRIMRPNAVLAVADMVSPPYVQAWLNQQHAMKQEFEWRDPKKEGKCYIPTTKEWLRFLQRAGYFATIFDTHVSVVATRQWVTGGQVNEAQKEALDEFILNAPVEAKRAFNIRQDTDPKTQEDLVKLNYPLVIITAVKK